MAIRKRSINEKTGYSDYPKPYVEENDSNQNNFSHLSNLPTNFNLKSISLEDCDKAVFVEFQNRFKIGENHMPIILLDAEIASLREQNFRQWDKDKEFLNGPFITMIRKESKPKYRNNPANKKVIYAIPITGPDGNVVIEEYISDGAMSYELFYEFKFITNFREHSNKFEEQIRYYFRNKRNIIVCNEERFSIGPVDYENFSTLELINSETMDQRTYYVSTYNLKLDCFVRDLSNMQKRLRPNKIKMSFDVIERDAKVISTLEEVDLKIKAPVKNDPTSNEL